MTHIVYDDFQIPFQHVKMTNTALDIIKLTLKHMEKAYTI